MMQTTGRPIYLDYHATTPTDPRVADIILRHMTDVFGNASSTDHIFGDEAEAAVALAKEQVASLVGAMPRDIIFTSGATESANLAIQGLLRAARRAGEKRVLRIGLMPVEHRAVLDTCEALADIGEAELHLFRVDERGRLDLEDYELQCRRGLDLICVMAANNEVGTVYPIQQAASIAHEYSAVFFCDATQAAGRIPIDFSRWGIDFLALSAHKVYGPKGCGALILAPDASVQPIIHGGGHQHGLRSGTLNVPGIAGLGEACRLRSLEMHIDEPAIALRRDALQQYLQDRIPELVVNGDLAHRLSGNLHVAVPNVPNMPIVARIRHRVALSTGAACSSGIEAPSHVLRAIGLPEPLLAGALRMSLGKFTTDYEVAIAGELIAGAVEDVRRALAR